MIQERDLQVIGDVIIKMLLEEIAEVNITQLKQIICMNLRYNQEQYSRVTYEELCVLVCERVIEFKTYPADEYQQIEQNYNGIKNKYYSIITEIENEMLYIDELIKIDKEHPQCCGSLIKKQNQLQARNNVNKSILKDLKKIEDEYYALFDLIQENYVYGEMLKYAEEKIEAYFEGTILLDTEDVYFYFNSMIRNKVAHGRNCFREEEYERISFELLLDLQYVIHLLEKHSDTNEAVEYVKNTVRWIEFSFSGECTEEQIYEKLLNSLKGNVIKHKNNFIGYVDSHQELYWIFNPYYEAAYEYAGVIELRDKLREYLTNENFWDYVLKYIQSYDEQEIPRIKLKQEFKSRVKAMQAYIAKNKRITLPLVSEVSKTIETMQLHDAG